MNLKCLQPKWYIFLIFVVLLLNVFYITFLDNISKSDIRSLHDKTSWHCEFTRVSKVSSSSLSFINIGLIIISDDKNVPGGMSDEFLFGFKKMLKSLLTFSSGAPINFVIVTNRESLRPSCELIRGTISQHVSEGVITRRWRRVKGVPVMNIFYVDVNNIIETDEMFFEAMKNISLQGNDRTASYSESLFYIAPVYHKAFRGLKQIIFLDSKDLEFRSDIELLHQQFQKMSPSALIGIGPELTPHYRRQLGSFLTASHQGYNSGVVLFQLGKSPFNFLLLTLWYLKHHSPTMDYGFFDPKPPTAPSSKWTILLVHA